MPVLHESRPQEYTFTSTLQALPFPLGLLLCAKVFTKSIKHFPLSPELLEHYLFAMPQTFPDFFLIVSFLKEKKIASKREKVMLNFPCGARQRNTMGVLCPGGMQGIPKMGTGRRS